MDFKRLVEKSKEDLILSEELDRDAKELPRKKAQWSEWLGLFSIEWKKANYKLNAKRKEKFEYYFVNYQVTLDKRDIREIYLPGDDEIIELEKAVEVARQKVELCERTLRSLTGTGFDIKNIIEYRKLMSGIV